LTNEGHAGKAYELAGDQAFSLTEFAAAVAKWSGKPITYKNLSEQDFAAALVSAGLPPPFARVLADADIGIARGDLNSSSGHLHRLIGRPTQTLEATLELLPRP
jgi:NAD(P)H dehydrogenase (quinone)